MIKLTLILSAILKSGVKGQICDGPMTVLTIITLYIISACIIKQAIFFTRQPLFYYSVEFLPRLFLSDECYKKLADLVVLTPQWLMKAMKVIMELTIKDDVAELSTSQLQRLVLNGVADSEVLEACWKRFLPPLTPSSGVSVHHLCLILQAYCLIYPVKFIKLRAEAYDRNKQYYIIPCKLPEKIGDRDVMKEYSTFYFDFFKFLPDEIYYRLICIASNLCKTKETQAQCFYNSYSIKSCFFYNLEDTNWLIEMEQENQRLKIMVL